MVDTRGANMTRMRVIHPSRSEVTLDDAKNAIQLLGVNPEIITPQRLKVGMEVELEHDGRMGGSTDVTGGDKLNAARIALAHFVENPGKISACNVVIHGDYYHYLEEIEQKNDRFWATNDSSKPNIFLGPVFTCGHKPLLLLKST